MSVDFGTSDVIALGSNTDIDTAEEDIVSVTDLQYQTFTQLTSYITLTSIGTHTSFLIRAYFLDAKSGTWFQKQKVTISSGLVEDFYYKFTSAMSGIIDFPISAGFGFKITGQGVGGANANVTVKLLGRNN